MRFGEMYCPRCGQEQASEALRYCSRCGFSLEGVAGLLAGGGLAPAGDAGGQALTPQQRGLRKRLMILVGGLLFLKLAVLLTLYKEDFFFLMLPAALLIIAGVMRGLYGLLLEADRGHSKKLKGAAEADTRELDAARAQTLPPAQPFSVTDSTTRLLEEEEKSARRKRQ